MPEVAWKFKTRNFTVRLFIEPEHNYRYDGDDEGGETQAKLDSGEYVAFSTTVAVSYRGTCIGSDHLGGSVYGAKDVSDFWTAHRDRDPMQRNCTLMRAKHGVNVRICHYFPGMVAEAIREARAAWVPLTKREKVRANA